MEGVVGSHERGHLINGGRLPAFATVVACVELDNDWLQAFPPILVTNSQELSLFRLWAQREWEAVHVEGRGDGKGSGR